MAASTNNLRDTAPSDRGQAVDLSRPTTGHVRPSALDLRGIKAALPAARILQFVTHPLPLPLQFTSSGPVPFPPLSYSLSLSTCASLPLSLPLFLLPLSVLLRPPALVMVRSSSRFLIGPSNTRTLQLLSTRLALVLAVSSTPIATSLSPSMPPPSTTSRMSQLPHPFTQSTDYLGSQWCYRQPQHVSHCVAASFSLEAILTNCLCSNPICHKSLTATGPDGKTVTVTVTDRCAGCAPGSIDLTPTAFQQLASLDVGRLHGISWTLI